MKFYYICRRGFVKKGFLLPCFKISTFSNHWARLGVNMTSWRGMYSLLNYPIYISYFIYHSFHWSRIRSYFSDEFIFVTACVHVYLFVQNRERLWDNLKITLLAIQQIFLDDLFFSRILWCPTDSFHSLNIVQHLNTNAQIL